MSGGSMNYLYSKVLHCADFAVDTPEREAFAKHLKLVAQALHDIEWVDSGDYGPGDEDKAIRACLPMDDTALLRQALEALVAITTARCNGVDISPINNAYGMADAAIAALRGRLGEKT